jgi:hypothetical protein
VLLQAQEQGFVDKVTDDDDAWIQRLFVLLLHAAPAFLFAIVSQRCYNFCTARSISLKLSLVQVQGAGRSGAAKYFDRD